MHALKNVMMVVVESLINKFEEDRMHDKDLASKAKKELQSGYYTDNCSDSDSSFNQVQWGFSLCYEISMILQNCWISVSGVALEKDNFSHICYILNPNYLLFFQF